MWKLVLALTLALTCLAEDSSDIDVGLHQICVWLPIGLASVLFYAVYLMASMDNGRDSLLYAKFLFNEVDEHR